MCLICIELDKKAMSVKEARRALGEMVAKVGADHAREVEAKLDEAETATAAPTTNTP
jgi:hypothetical protein